MLEGLSSDEVERRRARGESNRVQLLTSRPYPQIVRENVFSFVNTILFVLCIVLAVMGQIGDAVVSVGVVLINSLVGMVQEIRAKWTLDRIALLTRPSATVIRDGREQTVDPGEIVRGDLLVVRPGDQIVADGQVVGNQPIDVDESLLTGESQLVTKQPGDPVYSGSICMAGQGYYEAERVGAGSFANQLTAGARAFRREYTPLQREINLVIRVLLVLAISLEFLLVVDALIDHSAVVDIVKMSVVVVGLVPNGLVLAIAVAYGAGALRLVGQGILLQQANAVESLSHVDVVCFDKTGTLTTGHHQVEEIHPVGISSTELAQRLGDFAANVSAPNRTINALAQAFGGHKRSVRDEVPFGSEWRWSALDFDDPEIRGTYVLGAPEALSSSLPPDPSLDTLSTSMADRRLRVVVFAYRPEPNASHGGTARGPSQPRSDRSNEAERSADMAVAIRAASTAGHPPTLPPDLIPLGLVGLSDELRPAARETLKAFADSGIQIKIISGDNPRTVAALAQRVGFDSPVKAISGQDLSGLDEATLERVAEETTIFGRIAPWQKRDILQALRRRGHYVAMIGDGVNDVLSLKQANLGIAIRHGSPAARAVADLILLKDSFDVLPRAFREGQRIRNGMEDVLKLFLTRVFYFTLLLTATGIVSTFPLEPTQNALVTLFTVGIPSIALATWARPGLPRGKSALRSLFHFVLPAALTLGVAALAVHLYWYLSSYDAVLAIGSSTTADVADALAIPIARSALTTFAIVCGLLLVVFVEPPSEIWVGGDELSQDRRPTFLAIGLFMVYAAILASPTLRQFFNVQLLSALDYLLIGGVAIAWALILRWVWRKRLVERFLDLDTT